MKKVTAVLFLILVFSATGFSQQWKKMVDHNRPNFFEVQKTAGQFFQDYRLIVPYGKIPGLKQYKRWEWFAQQRLDQEGYLDSALLYQGWLDKQIRFPQNTKARTLNAASWQSIGPSSMEGITGLGRLNCITFDPQNPNIYWVGAPCGGLWKSTDAGQTWSTSTDNLPNLGVSDIVIHPQDSNIMYIATGDKERGSSHSYGVMKSTDGGQSWMFTGLNPAVTEKYKIGKLLMHPQNPDTLMCATSHGVFKTTDGGVNWLLKESGDFFDMEIMPGNTTVWYASRSKHGIYKSVDTGETWSMISNGLPAPSEGIGRIAIAVAPSSPATMFALYCKDIVGSGWIWGLYGFYQSTDAGESWQLRMSSPNILGWETNGSDSGGQGGFALVLEVNPEDSNLVFAGSVNLWQSHDGGGSWQITAQSVHVDHHELVYQPGTGDLFLCHDGGLHRSSNDSMSWQDLTTGLTIQQIYRLGVSQQNPDHIVAGVQDNGSQLFMGQWFAINGGDGMDCLIDPTNPNTVYSASQFGRFVRLDLTEGGGSHSNLIFSNARGTFAWLAPLIIDPADPNTLYTASNRVMRSNDRGNSSTDISHVLTGNSITILKIAPSDSNVLIASDGHRLFRTADGGMNWMEMDSSAMPTYITNAAIHPTNPDIMWVTVGGFGRWNSQHTWLNIPYIIDKPKVFYSTNSGASWLNVSGSIPNIPATSIVVDPFSFGVYVGTDLGVFYSATGTGDWQAFDQGLPNVIITDMEIHASTGTLVASTYGRGLWKTQLPSQWQLFPPLFFSGNKVMDQSFLQTGYVDVLKWAANPGNSDNDVTHYRIYKLENGSRPMIAEVNAGVFEYINRRHQDGTFVYEITATDRDGNESAPIRVSVK